MSLGERAILALRQVPLIVAMGMAVESRGWAEARRLHGVG